jgi:hypothetical protein
MSESVKKEFSPEGETNGHEGEPSNSKPVSFAALVEFLKVFLVSELFCSIVRKNPEDFTRNRVLTISNMFGVMINLIRSSTQTALNRFAGLFQLTYLASQQAFSKARKKIRWESCRYLMTETVRFIYNSGYMTWHGFILLAIDGSKIQLPTDNTLKNIFGALGQDLSAPSAQSSVLYDVLNGYIIDAKICSILIGERVLALLHLERLREIGKFPKALVLVDRGYASFDFIYDCINQNMTFIMRVKTKFNVEIDKLGIGCHNFVLTQNGQSIKLRVIKFWLSSGEIETLITNLFDYNLGIKAFKDLYFKRWKVETQFDTQKNKLQIENFSGRTEEVIYQDFYITIFLYNCTIVATNNVQHDVDEARKDKDNKYKYQVNQNEAIGAMKDNFIKTLMNDDPEERAKMVKSIFLLMSKSVTPIRPGRSYPRNKNPRKSKFKPNQKSNC